MHLDRKLNWKVYLKMKRQRIRERIGLRLLYLLVGDESTSVIRLQALVGSQIDLDMFDSQLSDCNSSSIIEIKKRGQKTELCTIVEVHSL